MILYGVSGLGADERVFRYLKLNHAILPIHWVTPHKNDSLESYAARLLPQIDQTKEFGIMGVSLGGMIAVEMSKKVNSKICILISSTETSNELRTIYRILGRTRILKVLPSSCFRLPKFLIRILFNAKNSKLLYQILNDTDPNFVKWALGAMTTWNNTQKLQNCIKIQGEKDILIPPTKDENAHVIKNGQHFMIVDKAAEISEILNKGIQDLN